ncbi:aminobenzoyl-glutamate utilization protein B [Clostridium tetanomorphum DSM 665]|nr:aminobenzoyl-glutamate utilization protein B [Clostridium tetanomorphum DSM 665]
MDYILLEELIKQKHKKFEEISDKIWEYAESGYKEVNSSALQRQVMSDEGFTVENGIGGITTAFRASFGSGKPVIAFLGEFDALPELSQKADVTYKEPLLEGGYGHGCGHHILGTACMQACVAIKDYLLQNYISGTVIYYGCPAEEGGAGKAFMVREGCFDDCDVCLAWHPYSVTIGSISSLANVRVYYNFQGISSHAAVSPHLGRSALDAVELMNVGVNYLREHIIPEARIHYAVTNSGGNAPNVVQAKAQVLYSIRAPKNEQVYELLDRVNAVAQGAAMMTGTKVNIQIVSAYADVVQNRTLDQLAFKHINEIYPIKYTDEELEYAKVFHDIGNKEECLMYQEMAKRLYGERGEGLFKGAMADGVFPPNPQKMGSTDVGDVSWNVPTTWFSGACFALGTPAHSWLVVAQGKSKIAHGGMTAAATVMARCAIDILKQPQIALQAEMDLKEALDGKVYQSIIPKETKVGIIE